MEAAILMRVHSQNAGKGKREQTDMQLELAIAKKEKPWKWLQTQETELVSHNAFSCIAGFARWIFACSC